MNKKQWYESLFENYAEKYDNENFTKGTIGECDFIETELNFEKRLKILDVGCGTGRHSIELSKRGYNVTGIDLSKTQLERAMKKAAENNLTLMETDEMNYEILKSVTKSLKEKCKFIFTTLNGLFPLYHSVEKFLASTTEEGNATYRSNTFDLMTFRDYNITEVEDDFGNKKKLECNERYYVPSEITWLLKSLGYVKVDIYGAKLGAFSREDKLSTEDFEMLVIAEK